MYIVCMHLKLNMLTLNAKRCDVYDKISNAWDEMRRYEMKWNNEQHTHTHTNRECERESGRERAWSFILIIQQESSICNAICESHSSLIESNTKLNATYIPNGGLRYNLYMILSLNFYEMNFKSTFTRRFQCVNTFPFWLAFIKSR